jgi:hypothetical protein
MDSIEEFKNKRLEKAALGIGTLVGALAGATRKKDQYEDRMSSIGRSGLTGAATDIGMGVGGGLGSAAGSLLGPLGSLAGGAIGAAGGGLLGYNLAKRKKKPVVQDEEDPDDEHKEASVRGIDTFIQERLGKIAGDLPSSANRGERDLIHDTLSGASNTPSPDAVSKAIVQNLPSEQAYAGAYSKNLQNRTESAPEFSLVEDDMPGLPINSKVVDRARAIRSARINRKSATPSIAKQGK